MCGQADLAADPRLDVKVSSHTAVKSLTDIFRQLGESGKVDLRPAQNVADRKLCAYFKDRPLREIMLQIATIFDGEWAKEGERYRFSIPNKLLSLEKDLLEKEAELLRAEAERIVKIWIEGTKQGTLSQLNDQFESLMEEAKRLSKDPSPEVRKKLTDINKEIGDLGDKISGYAYGCLLGQLSSQEMRQFWEGQPAYGSTNPDDGLLKLPKEVENSGARINTPEGLLSPTATVVMARYQPLRGVLDTQQLPIFATETGGMKTMSRPTPNTGMIDEKLKDHTYRKMADAWGTPLSSAEAQAIFDTKLDEEARKKKIESPYASGQVSLSEHLEWLHNATGLPIIAEAFRKPVEPRYPLQGAQTLKIWLKSFTEPSINTFGGYARIENGWVLIRPKAFWRTRVTEIPERVLLPLEAKTDTKTALTVDDYAGLANHLTPAQQSLFMGIDRYYQVTVKFDTVPLSEALLGLRVWATLDPAQKQAAKGETGVLASDLKGIQSDRYWETVRESLWSEIITQQRLRTALLRGSDPELAQGMRLFMREDEKVYPMSDRAPDSDSSPRTLVGQNIGSVFIFGQKPIGGLRFACVLKRPVPKTP